MTFDRVLRTIGTDCTFEALNKAPEQNITLIETEEI